MRALFFFSLFFQLVFAQYNKQWALDSVLMTFNNDSIILEKGINSISLEATACISVNEHLIFVGEFNFFVDNVKITRDFSQRLSTYSSCTQPYVFLPVNDSVVRFVLFTAICDGLNTAKINLYSKSVFGFQEVYNDLTLCSSSESNEKLAANKHANGRDWWVLFPAWKTNQWNKFLIEGDYFHGPFTQNIGINHNVGTIAGQLKFSQDGTILSSANELYTFLEDDFMEVFSFNRFTSKLEIIKQDIFVSRSTQFYYNNSFGAYGTEIYGNKVYYTSINSKEGPDLIRYDLNENKIDTLLTLENEVLGQLQLGNDKKIYIRHLGNSYLSVIENPDAPLDSLKLSYHKYKIPTLDIPAVYQPGDGLGLPYQPNYYLEPDLRAGFIVDSVSCVGRELAFTDTSQGHFWRVYDFGDGTTQKFHVTQHANLDTTRIDTHKVVYHSYKEPGTYQVKLTIVNDSSDVAPYYYDSFFTQKVIIYPSESCKENDFWFVIVPNPSPNSEVSYSLPQVGKMEIFNVLGQVILTEEIQKGIGSLPLPSELSAGCYQVRFSSSNFKPIVKKWIKF